jgi:hypothetical protein
VARRERTASLAPAEGRQLLDLNPRAPDAPHAAMAQRLEARLATLEAGLLAAARILGVRTTPA